MGPVIVLDKSALQLLSKDEISFLYKHYYVVIPPILIVEILADLSKKDEKGRIPEDVVRHLADKLSPMDSCINVHYREACLASLAGHDIAMDGRALISGGAPLITSTGERGVFIEEPPERKAIMNWRFGNFSEAERVLAQRWRESTRSINLEELQKVLKNLLPTLPRFKGSDDLFNFVNSMIDHPPNQRRYIIQFTLSLTKSVSFLQGIIRRWAYMGKPPFKQFAPYAYYCFKVMLGFHIGLSQGLVSTLPTNRIDMEYLFYLPFCSAFASRDNFHEKMARPLLRIDQDFVSGDVLKGDLKNIVTEWQGRLTEKERRDRFYDYGPHPPQNPDSITFQLWRKHCVPWKPGSGNIKMDEKEQKRLMEHLKPMMDAIKEYEKSKEPQKE